jgi:hypothetical protein
MQQNDYPRFKRLINRLGETLGKPVTDELLESWWKSLRTSSYDAVEHSVDRFLAKAGEGTRFPRPAQLRPTDDSIPGEVDRPWVRDFWGSLVVWELENMLCLQHRVTTRNGLEAWIAQTRTEHPGFGESLRNLLDELCDLEARTGQRTPGLSELCVKRTRAAATALLQDRGIV